MVGCHFFVEVLASMVTSLTMWTLQVYVVPYIYEGLTILCYMYVTGVCAHFRDKRFMPFRGANYHNGEFLVDWL